MTGSMWHQMMKRLEKSDRDEALLVTVAILFNHAPEHARGSIADALQQVDIPL